GCPESSCHGLCAQEGSIHTVCVQCRIVTVRSSASSTRTFSERECGLNLYNEALLQDALMKQSSWRVEIQRVSNNSSNLKQIVSPGSISFIMKSALDFSCKGLT
ncbi:hypothetical protein N322_00633, partial [Cariama cristata]